MELIDTHAHLDEEAFSPDRDEIVRRAVDAGLSAIITIGTTAQSSQRAVEIARQYPCLYAAVGIQPNYAAEAKPGDWDTIQRLAEESKVVAIGETGLDRYWDYAPFDLQLEYFARHIALSRRLGLPFVVHCREAEDDVVALLQSEAEQGPLKGVMHSFCGDSNTAASCLELGMYISFAGMLTFKKNDTLREVAEGVLCAITPPKYTVSKPLHFSVLWQSTPCGDRGFEQFRFSFGCTSVSYSNPPLVETEVFEQPGIDAHLQISGNIVPTEP